MRKANQSGAAKLTSLKEILKTMIESGKFQAAVLTYTEGLPVATVPDDYDSDLTAAMLALLQRVSDNQQSQLGMAEVDEVTIYGHDRIRMVCRRIIVGDEKLILAVVVPPDRAYRLVTNRAISQIKKLLSRHILTKD